MKTTENRQKTTPETLNRAEVLAAVNAAISEEPQTDTGADFCADRGASESAYICDAFSEYADGCIDIYNADLWKWAANNYEYIEEWRDECGAGKDILDDIRGGQFLKYERDLYDDIDGIKQTLAREYLDNVTLDDLTTTPERLNDALDDLINAIDNIDNNDRLDSIADACNDFINALNDDSDDDGANC